MKHSQSLVTVLGILHCEILGSWVGNSRIRSQSSSKLFYIESRSRL